MNQPGTSPSPDAHDRARSAPTPGNGAPPIGELKDQVVQLRDDARAVARSSRAVADDLRRSLERELDERPYVVLGAAAATGYVLGGGITRKLVTIALGVGLRTAVARAVGQLAGHATPSGANVHTDPTRS